MTVRKDKMLVLHDDWTHANVSDRGTDASGYQWGANYVFNPSGLQEDMLIIARKFDASGNWLSVVDVQPGWNSSGTLYVSDSEDFTGISGHARIGDLLVTGSGTILGDLAVSGTLITQSTVDSFSDLYVQRGIGIATDSTPDLLLDVSGVFKVFDNGDVGVSGDIQASGNFAVHGTADILSTLTLPSLVGPAGSGFLVVAADGTVSMEAIDGFSGI